MYSCDTGSGAGKTGGREHLFWMAHLTERGDLRRGKRFGILRNCKLTFCNEIAVGARPCGRQGRFE